MKKLGLALFLAVACIFAAPAVPVDSPADAQAEATSTKRKMTDFFIFYLCWKPPCPASDDECCVIREH